MRVEANMTIVGKVEYVSHLYEEANVRFVHNYLSLKISRIKILRTKKLTFKHNLETLFKHILKKYFVAIKEGEPPQKIRSIPPGRVHLVAACSQPNVDG